MKRTDPLAPLDARRMKLMALSGQIRATCQDGREVPKRLTAPQPTGVESDAPMANVFVPEETDGGGSVEGGIASLEVISHSPNAVLYARRNAYVGSALASIVRRRFSQRFVVRY